MNKLNVLSALRIKSAAELSDPLSFKKVKTVSFLPKVQSFDATISKNLLGDKRKIKKRKSSSTAIQQVGDGLAKTKLTTPEKNEGLKDIEE